MIYSDSIDVMLNQPRPVVVAPAIHFDPWQVSKSCMPLLDSELPAYVVTTDFLRRVVGDIRRERPQIVMHKNYKRMFQKPIVVSTEETSASYLMAVANTVLIDFPELVTTRDKLGFVRSQLEEMRFGIDKMVLWYLQKAKGPHYGKKT